MNNYLTPRRLNPSSVKSSLRIMDIELTNYCNHKCKFCLTGLNANARPKGNTDLDALKNTVRDVTQRRSARRTADSNVLKWPRILTRIWRGR